MAFAALSFGTSNIKLNLNTYLPPLFIMIIQVIL